MESNETANLSKSFEDLGVSQDIIEAIGYMGITKPTPIQQESIPVILSGSDLIACSQTGTGKTASFLIPIIQNCIARNSNQCYALVICPTRELALQIDQQCDAISYFCPITSMSLYGGGDGKDFVKEKESLKNGVNLIIGTPGKILSHLNLNKNIGLGIEALVLDEADRMLDMGFIEDIQRIVNLMPNRKQNLMFSATMAPAIRKLAKNLLTNPKEISFSVSKPAEKIKQRAVSIKTDDKAQYLYDYFKENKDIKSAIIFVGTKASAKFVSYKMQSGGFSAKSLHSDKLQTEREQIFQDFKSKKIVILIATNIASRGIDVEDVDVVINYDVPEDPADYVHRVGRTARAAKSGEAITLINPIEQRKWIRIEQLIEKEVEIEYPEAYPCPKFDRNNLFKPKGKGGRGRFQGKGRNKKGPSKPRQPRKSNS